MLRPSRVGRSFLRAVGLRPFEAAGLRRALAGAGLDVVESFTDGAVELVVGRKRGVA